jgi:predicted membrane protein
MPTQTRLNPTPQFAVGACLVLFGVLLSLDRLQLVDAAQSLRFWPIVLLVLGVWMVVDRRESSRSLPGSILIVIGGLFLLNTLGVARVRFWELFWPFLIVLIGTRLIMQTLGRGVPAGASTAPTSTVGAINLFALLGGSKRAINDRPFRGGEITAILGGTELDLRQATIEPGELAVITVFAVMGGHEVWVPSAWNVVSEVAPVLGSVEDKRLPAIETTPRPSNEAAPRLVLRGMVVMGGLTIKS